MSSVSASSNNADNEWIARVLTRDLQASCFVTAAETLLYGVYLVLFGFYINILYKQGLRKNRFLHSATIALFLLSTVHLALLVGMTVLDIQDMLQDMLLPPAPAVEDSLVVENALLRAAFAIYVTSNVIADSIFIFRCYAVWGFRLGIIVFPTLCTLAVGGFGYAHVIRPNDILNAANSGLSLFTVPILISLGTTILLMILSVSRIWSLARTAGQIMGKKTTGRYYTVCAMLLESGALYGVGALFLALSSIFLIDNWLQGALQSAAITAQLVGIAPTIIAVRVGLNKSVESVDSFVNMAQARSHPRPPIEFRFRTAAAIDQPVIYLRPESADVAGKTESV